MKVKLYLKTLQESLYSSVEVICIVVTGLDNYTPRLDSTISSNCSPHDVSELLLGSELVKRGL